MSEGSTDKKVGAKTFIVLMAVLIVVFLAGLLIMNNYYTSMQSELTATKAQVSNLQTDLYNLNQNYTLLQEVRNYLLNQVGELSEKVNLTQVVSRTFGYSIAIEYDNRTFFIADEWGNETSIRSPTATLRDIDLTPQTAESLVAEPWTAPLSSPEWLEEPVTGAPVGIILHTSAIRAYFSPSTFDWALTSSWGYVESSYREHHDVYNITMTGAVRLLYFGHNKTVSLALIDGFDIMSQVNLALP